MTIARAPGKVVLSGAYAVLHGAPAIVSAVGRYVRADSARPAELITPEVQAGLEPGERAPWFDASELREGGRKLGLGSSAAILVASLYALERDRSPQTSEAELRERVAERARRAHRVAQGGGSGIDVAASTFGDTLLYQLRAEGPSWQTLSLPRGVEVEVWTCPVSASTQALLAAVAKLGERSPEAHAAALGAQAEAAERAARASQRGAADDFVAALCEQARALSELGRLAGVSIVTSDLAAVIPLAEAEGGALLPAGAGGGDLAIYVGNTPSSASLSAALSARAHHRLHAALGAPGVAVA
jgi:phosphomevalonate kinase